MTVVPVGMSALANRVLFRHSCQALRRPPKGSCSSISRGHDLFDPQNPLRVKEALISLLAGDIFGKTPIWPSLAVLKGIYYLLSLGQLKRSIAAWRRRKVNIEDHGLLNGENVQAVK